MKKEIGSLPSADYCFGREGICKDIIASIFIDGAVVLLGGRQSGKSTILLRIRELLLSENASEMDKTDIVVPVYINLLSLSADAKPKDFFNLAALAALDACKKVVDDFAITSLPSQHMNGEALAMFERDIHELCNGSESKSIQIIFLFDESGRIVGGRFPKGFEDNLFYLLFSSDLLSGNIGAIFAGAQDLRSLIEDDGTSPIASRASVFFVKNLSKEGVVEMFNFSMRLDQSVDNGAFSDSVFSLSGGHAGISSMIVRRLALLESGKISNLVDIEKELIQQKKHLFEIWHASLGKKARLIHDLLIDKKIVSLERAWEITGETKEAHYHTDWAIDQLVFTGIAVVRSNEIRLVNETYRKAIRGAR